MTAARTPLPLRVAATIFALALIVGAGLLTVQVEARRHAVFGHTCVDRSVRDLDDPTAAPLVRMLVSSAENSTLEWAAQADYLEYNVEKVAAENRGYTGGIIGFTSKTGDMLDVVKEYARRRPGATLASFVEPLRGVLGTASRRGLGDGFVAAWHAAGDDPQFLQAQLMVADTDYLKPAVAAAREDGLGRLGQYIYYDAMVMHGPGTDPGDFGWVRTEARRASRTPADGGDEQRYLNRFLDVRVAAMRKEEAHQDVSRVESAQRRFLREKNFMLTPPLEWEVYGDRYVVADEGSVRCLLRY